MRICYDCLEDKELTAFGKGRNKCKECVIIKNKGRTAGIEIPLSVLDQYNKETIAANKKLWNIVKVVKH